MKCEICGKDLIENNGKARLDSPSIDKIIPEKGYVLGNIAILCGDCNRIKTNASWEQLQQIVDWIKSRVNNEEKDVKLNEST
jgi:5-methylcytosine-specific restriction endonuclease McrA